MLSNKNIAILACAGSGKTRYIVDEALNLKNQKILITTYTLENLDQIRSFFIERAGYIPSNISIQSWFSFLLRECVRPYQNYLLNCGRIKSILFLKDDSEFKKMRDRLRYIPEAEEAHYITKKGYIYDDKVSKFAFKCNEKSGGLIIKRLEKIFSHVFVDEGQDLAGYDLELLNLIMKSGLAFTIVGDPRQGTFITNRASKNKQYRRSNILRWLSKQEKSNHIKIEENNTCHRCNQIICDFADRLFPNLPRTISKNPDVTEHDGVFYIPRKEIGRYVEKYNPVILRYSKNTSTLELPATNIGLSKGKTFDRVLILPTNKMLKYFKTQNLDDAGDVVKLYIAVTRARNSVTFVIDET